MNPGDFQAVPTRARRPATATALSRPERHGAAHFGQTSVVARLSLTVVSMSLCAVGITGCFDAPPEYSVPELLPPLLDARGASPPISTPYRTSAAITDLRIPFRVIDSDDAVQAAFILDLGVPGMERQLYSNKTVQGDTIFNCKGDWKLVTSPGCHTITVRASYVRNFEDQYDVTDLSLASEATWFAALSADDSHLEVCFGEAEP
jgi:hypothetical protein